MTKTKNKIIWATMGSLLIILGGIATISLSLNKEYAIWIIATGLTVIIGVILNAWAISE